MMDAAYQIIEAEGFTEQVQEQFGESYEAFQLVLVENPNKGDVMPGMTPWRKVRWLDPKRGKGKRSGIRVIYIHVEEIRTLFLADVYGKDEKDDLSFKEKKQLREIGQQIVEALKAKHHGRRVKPS